MRRGIAVAAILIVAVLSAVAATHGSVAGAADNRLQGAFRKPAVSGWTFVHLQGAPAQIGYQHGYLLSAEILDLEKALQLELTHDNGKGWNFFRDAAKNSMWPHISEEYREELQGIADGLNARGVKMDLWDVVAMNATETDARSQGNIVAQLQLQYLDNNFDMTLNGTMSDFANAARDALRVRTRALQSYSTADGSLR